MGSRCLTLLLSLLVSLCPLSEQRALHTFGIESGDYLHLSPPQAFQLGRLPLQRLYMPIEVQALVLMIKYGGGARWTRLPDYDNCTDELAWLLQRLPHLETGQTNTHTTDRMPALKGGD